MTYTYNPDDINRRELAPGVFLRTMWGEKIMMSLVEISPNSEVPMHEHPHEQAGMVLEGEFDFTIGGVTTRVKKGDTYVIPGGVEHYVKATDQPASRPRHLQSAPRRLQIRLSLHPYLGSY